MLKCDHGYSRSNDLRHHIVSKHKDELPMTDSQWTYEIGWLLPLIQETVQGKNGNKPSTKMPADGTDDKRRPKTVISPPLQTLQQIIGINAPHAMGTSINRVR